MIDILVWECIELCVCSPFYDAPISHGLQYPTKAICPILLEDYRKITVERKGETNFFTSQMIKNCMKKGMFFSLFF
jgi:predicted metal-dependent RNase